MSLICNFPANEFWGNSEPVCPYCKTKNDISEYNSVDGEVDERVCDECEKTFYVQTIVSVEYSTVGKCDHHKLKRSVFFEKIKEYECVDCRGTLYDFNLEKLSADQYTILDDQARGEG